MVGQMTLLALAGGVGLTGIAVYAIAKRNGAGGGDGGGGGNTAEDITIWLRDRGSSATTWLASDADDNLGGFNDAWVPFVVNTGFNYYIMAQAAGVSNMVTDVSTVDANTGLPLNDRTWTIDVNGSLTGLSRVEIRRQVSALPDYDGTTGVGTGAVIAFR